MSWRYQMMKVLTWGNVTEEGWLNYRPAQKREGTRTMGRCAKITCSNGPSVPSQKAIPTPSDESVPTIFLPISFQLTGSVLVNYYFIDKSRNSIWMRTPAKSHANFPCLQMNFSKSRIGCHHEEKSYLLNIFSTYSAKNSVHQISSSVSRRPGRIFKLGRTQNTTRRATSWNKRPTGKKNGVQGFKENAHWIPDSQSQTCLPQI
jgi:hypothetical protein